MTPGTRPAARSLRATPLPDSERISALRDADAMMTCPDDALTACSEPRIRSYSQAAASALPCRRCVKQHIAGTYNLELLFFGSSVFRFTACLGQLVRPEVRRSPTNRQTAF